MELKYEHIGGEGALSTAFRAKTNGAVLVYLRTTGHKTSGEIGFAVEGSISSNGLGFTGVAGASVDMTKSNRLGRASFLMPVPKGAQWRVEVVTGFGFAKFDAKVGDEIDIHWIST